MIYIRRLFLFVVVFSFVMFEAQQAYAVCNPPECGGVRGTCEEMGWGTEFVCLDQCCVAKPTGEPLPTIPSGGSYTAQRCAAGQYLSCGTTTEAASQNKSDCTYQITCNKYFWASSYNYPLCRTSPTLFTCYWNCSCCAIGTSRTCTLGSNLAPAPTSAV